MSSLRSDSISSLAVLVALLTATDPLLAAPSYGCGTGTSLTENARANSQSTRLLAWKQMLNSEHYGSDREKLERVNRFFNEFRFVSDDARWGQGDQWATPVELLESGVGDCEDFALAKYISLRCLGVSVHRLRLTYTFALKLNKAHLVLAYLPGEHKEPLILDNLIADIRPASARRDLVPVYSFNDDSLWLNTERGASERIGDSSCIKVWNELRARIRASSRDQ